jgi:hypothetical protein
MCEKTGAEENPAARIDAPVPWEVVDVRVLPDFRLCVRFADGTGGEVDLSGLLAAEDVGVFEPLRDPRVFAQAGIVDGAVTWPGELDLAPDAMYDEIRDHGFWIPT